MNQYLWIGQLWITHGCLFLHCMGVCVVRALLFEGVPGFTLSLSHAGGPDSSHRHCLWARVPPHTTGPCLCSHRGTISSSSSCLCLAAFSGSHSLWLILVSFCCPLPLTLAPSLTLILSLFCPPWFCKWPHFNEAQTWRLDQTARLEPPSLFAVLHHRTHSTSCLRLERL